MASAAVSVGNVDIGALASSLRTAFICGSYSEECCSGLRKLFPAVSLLSISQVAGSKVLVTQANLLEAGFATVHFDRPGRTAAGQALLSGTFFEARHPDSRSFLDLGRAHSSQGCTTLLSLPIFHPRQQVQQASHESEPSRSPSPLTHDTSSRAARGYSWGASQDDCFMGSSRSREQAPMGCMTIGLQDQHGPPTMTHLNSLHVLTDLLGPILEQGLTAADGHKTAFGQAVLDSMVGDRLRGHGSNASLPSMAVTSGLDLDRWGSLESWDGVVDDMVCFCRCHPSAECCNCAAEPSNNLRCH